MIKYFCDLCGKEIDKLRTYRLPYVEDRDQMIEVGGLGNCYVGESEIHLCKTCAYHLEKKITKDLQELKDSMPLEAVPEMYYA